ncbi:cadmium-translocating P-type ATPase [Sulfurospirillum sp. T05]|uniref:P-type Zn(2+) transporter n=1 Tax=Sulfurospirillum tamanense TaxID=2813362 RepID=A0ABS2WQV3_9BACT|nr:heavy metal translocating P-type ATPase [Sulfurospirillum tamanensis]MBN2964015.1 cadmium-translocating P-type ATPase [Sulfurospirillum tamanensis]
MSHTRKYRIEGLSCAHCAAKVETKLNSLSGIEHARIDFAQGIFTLQTPSPLTPAFWGEVEHLVHTQEPSVSFKPLDTPVTPLQESPWKEHVVTPRFLLYVLGVFLFSGAFFTPAPFDFWLFLAAYGLIGGEIVAKAVRNLTKGHVFDENFLMSIATIGAFSIGEYPEGVAVMLFYRVGEFFQDLAVGRSRRSISTLMDIRPDTATLLLDGVTKSVSPQEVLIGSKILVRVGEKIPLDGVLLEGTSTLDTSALTGESLPRDVGKGDTVLSGSINQTGLLTLQTTTLFADSTVAKILDLVQNAGAKKAKTEQFITSFAKIYTPVVVGAAVLLALLPPLLLEGATFSEWFGRALVFLVVSCPCALVVSIPLSFFGGIGGASKRGILVKGGNFLEALKNVETIVFDKTGTLTEGVFRLQSLHPANGFDEASLLGTAAQAERHSTHPIARSIVQAFGADVGQEKGEVEELAGFGVKARFEGKEVLVGNYALLEKEGITASPQESEQSVVYVAVNGVYAGALCIADTLKRESIEAIQALKELGITRLVMLTGDREEVARVQAQKLGITEVYAGLLPHQKVEKLESLLGQGKVAFVGDGINDAPVLARADVGIAMGGVGSDAAIEASDVVIMDDNLGKIPIAIALARKTHRIVWQNIVFALGVKGVILVLGAFGIAGMWEAVFGDVGVALIAILNASRVLR